MWCSKILAAYDGSPSSENALKKAKQIAESNSHIQVRVVYVVKLYGLADAGGNNLQALQGVLFHQAEEALDKARKTMESLAGQVDFSYVEGISPAEAVLAEAEKGGSDLIVIGSRGRSGVKGFLGSVSNGVVHQAKIPVLIVK